MDLNLPDILNFLILIVTLGRGRGELKGLQNNLQWWKLDNSIVIHTLRGHKGLPIVGAFMGVGSIPQQYPYNDKRDPHKDRVIKRKKLWKM